MRTDPLIGASLGDYVATELLGRGGMSRVYLAQHRRTGVLAAVKVIETDLAGDAAYSERFKREARNLCHLSHPRVVGCLEFGVSDNLHYLVVEYVEGADLRWALEEYGRQGELIPVADAQRIVEQVAEALDYIHASGVVHRDIKPANILLDRQGQAFLSDFGVAANLFDTQPSAVLGSAYYAAPEQASGGRAAPQSDVYSLSVVLFEMLTGKTPFEGDSAMALALKHVNAPPPRPSAVNPGLPPALDAVILRGLAKEPEGRYPTAGALAADLRRALREAPDEHTQPNPRVAAGNGHGPAGLRLPSKRPLAEVIAQRGPARPRGLPAPAPAPASASPWAIRVLGLAPLLGVLCAVLAVGLWRGPALLEAAPSLPGNLGLPGLPRAPGEETPAPAPADVLMLYDENAVTVINPGTAPLTLAGVRFEASGENGAAGFAADEWIRQDGNPELLPGHCYRLIRYGVPSAKPAECVAVQRWISTSDSQLQFWNTAGAGEFAVLQNEAPVSSCRLAEGQCSFTLPQP
jgi:hypothetical protein